MVQKSGNRILSPLRVIEMVDFALCTASTNPAVLRDLSGLSQIGHDRPLADLPQSSLSGTVGVCFDPILRRAAFHDFLMVYGNGKYTTESLMEQGFDCDSRCRVMEQASELGRKTVSAYQS